MDPYFLMSGAESCAGWLVGLTIAIAGFASVRGALPRAGYMIGGAGLALFVRWCCIFGPNAVQQYSPHLGSGVVFQLTSITGMLLRLIFAALFLGGAVILAREVKARRAGAGGA